MYQYINIYILNYILHTSVHVLWLNKCIRHILMRWRRLDGPCSAAEVQICIFQACTTTLCAYNRDEKQLRCLNILLHTIHYST